MKKNLLFASLILAAVPAFADGPVRSASDPHRIFLQDFESDFEAWSSTPVDSIEKVRFYNHVGKVETSDGNFNDKRYITDPETWNTANYVERDSFIYLKNGVVPTDDKNEIKTNAFRDDSYTIIAEGKDEAMERQKVFDKFGEDGGTHYFQYKTGDTVYVAPSQYGGSYNNHAAVNYRRNLMVRGIPVEDSSSYRLTLYLKTKVGKFYPKFFADVMRGYFHSEKPFSMLPYYDSNKNWFGQVNGWSASAFAFATKDESSESGFEIEDDTWQKITVMSYYINDSIAEKFVSMDGYWWSDDWTWNKVEGNDTLDYHYVIQPDKYFVRLGFASDNTTFQVDNVSLTKSWIGGAEYVGNGMRVDFGYETNLGALAQAAKDKNKIAAVELPGNYFTVWGLYEGEWYDLAIKSAEYHGDGYMYMWAKSDTMFIPGYGEMIIPADFGDYDSVLVSFNNPVDRKDLALTYTGSLYPRSEDTVWVKNGKYVLDFVNEIATPNSRCMDGVYSMYELPPVVQEGITYEFGSFQLPVDTRELVFKVSRACVFDGNPDGQEAQAMVTKAGVTEFWPATAADDSTLTITRPERYTGDLEGDYQFSLIHLHGEQTDQAEPYAVNYSFGPVSTEGVLAWVTFDNASVDKNAKMTIDFDGFSLEKCAVQVVDMAKDGLRTRGMTFGILNQKTGVGSTPSADNCAKLIYTFNVAKAGNYDFEAQFARWGGTNRPLVMGLYNSSNVMLEAGQKNEHSANGERYNAGNKVEYVDTIKFSYNITAAGTYKLILSQPESPETVNGGAQRDGFILFTLGVKASSASAPSMISYPLMSQFDIETARLSAILADIESTTEKSDKYKGKAYEDGKSASATWAVFNTSTKETAPSKWNEAIIALQKATGDINSRISLVDNMLKQAKILQDTLAYFVGKDADAVKMASYESGMKALADYKNVKACDISDDSVTAITKVYTDAQAAIVAQYAVIEPYQKMLAVVKDSVNSESALNTYDEYGIMKAASEASFDEFASTAEQVKAETAKLCEVLNNYIDAPYFDKVELMYLDGLDSLTAQLGVDLSKNAGDIAASRENREFEKLELLYKNAIKYAVYSKIANKENVDSLPLTALIKNSPLYAHVKLADRMDIQWPAQVLNTRDAFGNNMVRVRHQYGGDRAIAVMILDQEYADLLPYWNAKAVRNGDWGGGNGQISVYSDMFTHDETFFDGTLSMDWGSKVTLTQSLDNLPVGTYSFGLDFFTAAPDNSNSSLDVTVNGKKASATITAKDTVVVENKNIAITGTANLEVSLGTKNSNASADGIFLIFTGAAEGPEYADLAQEAFSEYNKILTFDDAADEAEAQYEYHTLDGIKTDAPEGVVIRVNLATGESERVLIK